MKRFDQWWHEVSNAGFPFDLEAFDIARRAWEACEHEMNKPAPAPFVVDRPDRHGDGSDAADYESGPAVRMPDDEREGA